VGVEFIVPIWLYNLVPEMMYNFITVEDVETGSFVTLDKHLNVLSSWKYEELDPGLVVWLKSLYGAEQSYQELIRLKWRPEEARDVLPNATATEIVISANLREWRHIFKLRTSKRAYPPMRELMTGLLSEVKNKIGVVFEGI
jgi:thymidylate synthase (FAD)